MTGLQLPQYLRLYFSVWILHNELQGKHPAEINANPSIINFPKDRIFALLDWSPEDKRVFFERVLIDLQSLTEHLKKNLDSTVAWQFDFTSFRTFPLVYTSDAKEGFTCLAFPFITEKLASGIYHTILNSWPEEDPERGRFQSYWGKVFERFVNDRLGEAYPPSGLITRLHTNPFFLKKKNKSVEVSDAVINYGDSLVLIEHKGGFLSTKEKYSDNVDILLNAVAKKFGLKKGIHQLTRSIGLLFNADSFERDTFSEIGVAGERINVFPLEQVRQVRKVYPVISVQDPAMANGFMNRRLRLQFMERLRDYQFHSSVTIRPLSLLTVENLENVLTHIDKITLPDILEEYSSYKHKPRTTFNEILDNYLEARDLDTKRRYEWSVKRCAQIIASISEHFINA